MKKQRLGRGLNLLIPQGNQTTDSSDDNNNNENNSSDDNTQSNNTTKTNTLLELPLTDIIPNDQQPRTVFDDELISELAKSILEKGVIQPIVVTKTDSSDKYMIIEGERRWRASGLAGKTTIPAIYRKVDTEVERLELALITNAQREDLNPIELAKAYKKLIDDFNYRQEDLGKMMGKSRSAITNRLRLLNLPSDVLQAIEDKVITEGHGRALLTITDPERTLELYREIVDKDLTVRDIEKLVNKVNKNIDDGANIDVASSDSIDPHVGALAEEFENFFSSKVIIKDKNGSGTIEIKYRSHDDLDRIIKKVRGEI